MRTAQLTAWQPPTVLHATRRGLSHSQTLKPSNLSYPFSRSRKNINLSLKNTSSSSLSMPVLKSRRSSSIVCLSNSNSAADSEGSPWKAFGKALGNVTGGRSIEDVLKQQMQKKEFYPESGGSGGGPPRGGGGGDGGGGGSDGSDGTEGEDFWDEALQVFLATIGLLALYIYLIKGDELIRLAKDYRILKITGVESDRLKRIRLQWRWILECMEPTPVEEDPFWLENLIMNTKTQYDSPEKYQQIVEDHRKAMPPGWEPKPNIGSFLEDSDDDDDNDNDNGNDDDDSDF